jgi:uncharacterized protein (TIGR02444 family)
MPDESPEPDLWDFSSDFYSLPRVAPALIALQDRDGLDVNLMLFALWCGVTGRGPLDHGNLAAAERAVRDIGTEIIAPLRALRRRLKGSPDKDVQSLRGGVKTLELAAERLAQDRLAHRVGPADRGVSAEARLAAAHANLVLYLGPRAVATAEAILIRNAVAEFIRPRFGTSGATAHPSA